MKAHVVGLRRAGWGVAVAVLLYVGAWLGVPPLLRAQLQTQGSEILGRQVTVAQVRFNPLTLELEVGGVAVAAASGNAPQLRIGRVYVNAAAQSLWRLAPVIDALEIDDPVLRVAQTGPGAFDFDDIVQRFSRLPAAPAGPGMRFALYNVRLSGGEIDFDDQTVHVQHQLRALALSLPFLSNLPADREVKVLPRLAFELDGSRFDTSAQATPFDASHQTQARLRIQGFDLAPLAAYVPASLGVKLEGAKLDADLGLDFAQRGNAPEVRLSGTLRLDDVNLADARGDKLMGLGRLDVALGDVRPLQRQVELASVELRAPHAYLRRDASGVVQLPGRGADATSRPAPAPPGISPSGKSAPAAAPWTFAVRKLQVQDGAIDWQDESLKGSGTQASWQVRDWQAQIDDAAWPAVRPAQFRSALRLSGGAASGEPARIEVQGEASESAVQATVTLSDVSAALAAPYLAQFIVPELAGMLDAKASFEKEGDALTLKVAQLRLSHASLSCARRKGCATLRQAGVARAGREEQLALGQLDVADASVDLNRHRVQVARVSLSDPQVLLARDKAGAWMFEGWRVPATSVRAEPEGAAPEWSAMVRELRLAGGSVALRDAGAREPVALDLSALDVGIDDLAWEHGRLPAFGLKASTRVASGKADRGQLSWDGSMELTSGWRAKGKLRAKNLPLQVVQAYLPDELNVDVLRADGDFTGDVNLAGADAGLSVGVQGDAALQDVQVRLKPGAEQGTPQAASDAGETVASRDAADGEAGLSKDLLRWKALSLRGLSLALAPGKPLALDVRETALTDFFARVIVQESGRINLQDIGRAAAAPASDQGAAVAAASAGTPPSASPPARIHFGPVALVNGNIDFTDHFIKPNYSANLTELTGSLSAFSSEGPAPGEAPAMAQLELKGRAQGTATLDISGRINPLVTPLALDIQGHMRDLELPPLSPYSVKYAGHGIERGKMSVDVGYKVQPDGQLTASNKLVLKQLAFGDEVKGAPNSLPVRLAVALLADRNGVIDVDLPISGSLNDPDFSLGPVIMKVIGNLIMKAITAPFSLLAHALGGAGDEKGDVAFAPGSSALSTQARERLDAMAKALADRPALKATVVGWAAPQTEQPGWRHERLMDMLLAEKRREAVQAGQDATQVTQVSDGEQDALLKRVYQRADDIKKPRNLIGLAKDIAPEDMEKLLLASIIVPDNAMPELALARSVAVRDYLATHGVPMDRLFVGASKLVPPGGEGPDAAPRVQLELAAD